MRTLCSLLLGAALVADTCLFHAGAAPARGRLALDLDGVWQFATDPEDVGESELWSQPGTPFPPMPRPGYAADADGRIRVPGAWDAQGYGLETDKLRHQFDGRGWYRREVRLPASWGNRRVFLTIGGVMRAAKTWVNGAFLGEHVGYISAFEHEVTHHVTPGHPVSIVIAVDSRWDLERDPLMGCGMFVDYMGSGYGQSAGYGSTSEATWGGIWGHVALEARGAAWLDELHVEPQIAPSSATITARLHGRTEAADAVGVRVQDGRTVLARRFALTNVLSGDELRIAAEVLGAIPAAKLWSFRHPSLYRVTVTLERGSEVIDEVQTRTGLREIRVEGPHFLLNGQRIFLSGYGDDAIYPETTAWPCDVRVYRERLRVIKSYGFNYVRHHSHMLPDEYYEACDELGLMVQPESPMAYGYRAKTEAARQLYLNEWRAGILRHRNHPSLVTWCVGNEGSGGTEIGREFQHLARALGGNRLFIGTDGIQHGGWEQGESDLMDFLTPQFDVFQSVLDVPRKFSFAGPPAKPVIAHEEGNYVAFPRFDQIGRWRHQVKPFWLTSGRDRLGRLGLLDEAPRWARHSEGLYLQLHKANLESLRLNPNISGYHWWLFQDFWTTHNGIVDAYFRPKFRPERILPFNGDSVLLQDGLARSYRGGDPVSLRFLLSHYGEGPLPAGQLTWQMSGTDGVLMRHTVPVGSLAQGELAELAAPQFALPDLSSPEPLRLEAELRAGRNRFRNAWTTWLYPARVPTPPSARPVYADAASLPWVVSLGARPIPPGNPKPVDASYVCRHASRAVLDAVEHGARLVVLSRGDGLPGTRSRYKLPWWRAGRDGSNLDEGTVVYPHPATRGLAPEGWCDAHWYELIDGAFGVFVDELPARPEILIRGIEGPIEVRDKAFLFAGRLGEGEVMVSGLNHARAAGLPLNDWLLARLLGPSVPARRPVQVPRHFLEQSPVEPGCLAGYVRLSATPSEEMSWHTYREDLVPGYFCRQTSPTNAVAWETAPAPKPSASGTVRFVFAGGLGYVSQPDAGGFRLALDGRHALDFDLSMESKTWTSADGAVTLRFEVKRRLELDALGFFYLSVPADRTVAGQPLRLKVSARGEGSRRWFALHPYTDLVDE